MALLFILLLLLYQIGCDKIEDEVLTEGERYLDQLQKSCLKNEGNVKVYELSKCRLEGNLKFIQKCN